MLDIFGITLPIFVIIGLGFLAVHFEALRKSDVHAFGGFVMGFAVPALILRTLSQRPIAEVLNAGYMLAYAAGSVAIFAAALLAARLLGKGLPHAALQGMGASISNSGFVGYPIAALVLGPATAVTFLVQNMIVENMLMLPLALVAAELGADDGARAWTVVRGALARLVRSPIIIAIVLGGALSLMGLQLPGPIFKAADLLAMSAAPLALFAIGGNLARLRVRGMLGDVAQVVAGKLVLHPLAVGAALLLVPGLTAEMMVAGIIFASVPMLSIYALFGQRWGREGVCATALLVATAASFLTVTVFLGLLDAFGYLAK